MDPEEAAGLFETLRRTWRGMKLGWWDQLMRTQNGPVNLHAANMEADAQQAMGIAQSGDMQFALYSSNVICLDENRDKLHEAARLIMKTIQNIGFSCRLEDVNAIEAWRGSLPGDGYSNVRRVPLHTLNLADPAACPHRGCDHPPHSRTWKSQSARPMAIVVSSPIKPAQRPNKGGSAPLLR